MTFRTLAFALLCGILLSPQAYGESSEDRNKEVVQEFYNATVNDKDFEAASRHLGPHYIQHNPNAVDGAQGLKGFIGFLQSNFPDSRSEIKRTFADDDHVVLHVHSRREPGARGRAIMELFRLEDGKIVEHWDVVQDIPEESANDNGMF